jgi:RNA polymerase sigma factor (sigma-70 family)
MEQVAASDAEVIREILDGAKEKYALIIKKYNQRLYRICKGYLKSEAEIEDVMQDTYVKAYENLSMFEGRSAFGTWLTRILINECLQRLRKISKQGALITNNYTEKMNTSDNTNPETNSLNRELKVLIEQNLERLPHDYRIVFLMREVERMNVAETAEALLITESNVKVRLNRAKEMLKRSMLESYPMEELYHFNLVRCARIAENVLGRIAAA